MAPKVSLQLATQIGLLTLLALGSLALWELWRAVRAFRKSSTQILYLLERQMQEWYKFADVVEDMARRGDRVAAKVEGAAHSGVSAWDFVRALWRK